jgi:hypothetical protein
VQRIWKEFIERATRLTPTIAMAPFTCELWKDWCSVTFSELWSHHCKGSKELLPQFLSPTSRNCSRKTSYQIVYINHIEAMMRCVASCINCVQSCDLL